MHTLRSDPAHTRLIVRNARDPKRLLDSGWHEVIDIETKLAWSIPHSLIKLIIYIAFSKGFLNPALWSNTSMPRHRPHKPLDDAIPGRYTQQSRQSDKINNQLHVGCTALVDNMCYNQKNYRCTLPPPPRPPPPYSLPALDMGVCARGKRARVLAVVWA